MSMQHVGRKKGKRVWKEEEKRKVRKKRKGKGLMGFVALFRFVHCVFHSFLSPFQPTMPPHFFSPSHSPHHTAYHTITHREHATQPRLCAVVFLVCVLLCLCVTVCLLIPHSTKQHSAMETGNHYTRGNQWMRQCVNGKEQWCVDTTAQTQGTRRK